MADTPLQSGWLVKQRHKRYFLLGTDGVLRWMNNPQGAKVNGSLALSGVAVDWGGPKGKNITADAAGAKHSIVLTPRSDAFGSEMDSGKKRDSKGGKGKGKGGKVYVLEAMKGEDPVAFLQPWYDALYRESTKALFGQFEGTATAASAGTANVRVSLPPQSGLLPGGQDGQSHYEAFSATQMAQEQQPSQTATRLESPNFVSSEALAGAPAAVVGTGMPPAAAALNTSAEQADASSATSCPSRSGWLEKKGKRRFFVAQEGILYWFSMEVRPGADLAAQNPNGMADLTDCDIRAGPNWKVKGHSSEHNLSFQESSGKDVYVVTAATAADCREWLVVLTAAKEWAQARITQLTAALTTLSPESVQIRGYLTKKKERRFFKLADASLRWWDSEKASHAGQPNGSIMLKGADVLPVPGQPKSMAIQAPAYRYVLSADFKIVFALWSSVVARACQVGMIGVNAEGDPGAYITMKICGVSVECGTPPTAEEESNRVSDSLRADIAAAVADEDYDLAHSLKAQLEAPESMSPRGGDSPLLTKGWLKKKGQRRYFVISDDVLMWFESEKAAQAVSTSTMKNSLPLPNCTIDLSTGGFDIIIKSRAGRSYELTATTSDEAQRWVASLRKSASGGAGDRSSAGVDFSQVSMNISGPAEKMGKRRYFVLDAEDGSLSWFENEKASQQTKRAKNFLALTGCLASSAGALALLIVQPRGKTYQLAYPTDVERDRWLSSLQVAIANANSKVDAGFLRCGHLEKKKKQRWFALNSEGLLLWFDNPQPFRFITKEKANGHLQVGSPEQQIGLFEVKTDPDHPLELILSGEGQKPYRLKAKTEEDSQAWLAAFREAKYVGTTSMLRATCFGAPLDRLTMSPDRVPVVLENLTAFISQYGTQVQGVFRISASVDRMGEMRRALEVDDTAQPWWGYNDELTVHAVAGLLKELLRAMPDPLIPFNGYESMLQVNVNDPQAVGHQLGEVLGTTNGANARALKHLFSFVTQFASHVEQTAMDFSNLAIVFGPNVLRPPEDLGLRSMMDMPKVLSVTRTIIEQGARVWEAMDSVASASTTPSQATLRRGVVPEAGAAGGGWGMVQTPASGAGAGGDFSAAAGAQPVEKLDVSAVKTRAAPPKGGRRPPTRKPRARPQATDNSM